ncbi:AAA family ATPase (plasmid) [Fusobacteria bacterium ZRK30]|nr:AAA family ATPase [Fusobacteria bacterium ZRK30]
MIISVKLNKGGSAKTWTSVQVAHALALNEKKVLLLTSDSQNNTLDFLGYEGSVTTGLKAAVNGKEHEIYRLRDNLEVLPLEDNFLSKAFFKKLKKYLDKMREKYEFIIIDSIPTKGVDDHFVELSDKVIIPIYCDRVTVEGALEVIENIGKNKILAIIPSRYKNEKNQKEYHELLKESLDDLDVLLTDPVKHMSFIAELIDKGKTIWESNNKKITEVQDIFIELTGVIINE